MSSQQQHQFGAETRGPPKALLGRTETLRDAGAAGIDDVQLAPEFEVRLEPARGLVRVRLIGELDLATGPKLREQVTELLSGGFEHLIIDLQDLSFLDATGLTLLLALTDQARDEGWRLSLVPGHGQVRRIFELTDTLSRLPFRPIDEAMTFDDLDTILIRARQAGIDRWRVMIALGIDPEHISNGPTRELRATADSAYSKP